MRFRYFAAIAVVAVLAIALVGEVRKVAAAADTNSTLQAQVRVLMDKQAIHDGMMRYARGVDRGDADLVTSVYWPDAVDDHGGGSLQTGLTAGPGFTRGRKATSKRHQLGQHFVGNDLIDVQGDVAYAEFYFMSNMPVERDGVEYLRPRAGRYLDRWERRNGQWKIAYRVVTDDWDRLDKFVEAAPGSANWRRGDIREKDPYATMKSGATADAEKVLREKLATKK